ncbi:FG-GAP repeat domain protein [Verrucomicrobiia bacterium DG1235]|nr:FG-GAP repeat domain protein [Verrucomicrobiae bacterium DG1235]
MEMMRLPLAAGNASKNALGNFKLLLPIFLLLCVLTAPGRSEVSFESVPFAPRSKASGSTLFTELPEGSTGISTTNRYDDPRMWGERYRVYQLGSIGTGVAVGDYDGDGRPDIFVVSKIESGRLFRNLGDWRFEDVTEAAGVQDVSGEWKQGASFVDVNNDGLLDLYVCRLGVANQLFINQGDGTFRDEAEERGLALVEGSGMGCFADYDRDGWLDVYIQTNLMDDSRGDGQPDYLFRNEGDGYFRDVSEAAGISSRPTRCHSATWWDQNEDGWLDLYVANDFSPPDFLYRNNGDGTFTNVIDQALPHTTYSSMGADLGDVDNDGDIDFFVADMAGSTHELEQRGQAESRAVGHDGKNEKVDTAIQILDNALYLNTGTDRSLEAANLVGLRGTDWTWSPRFEDFDQDGRLDLFVTNGMDNEQNNVDLMRKRLSATSMNARRAIAKLAPVWKQANLAYANRGELRFEEVGEKWGLDKFGVSFGSATGDFDGDGDLDIVFTNFEEGPTVLRNDSQSGNAVIVELRGVVSNRYGLGARVEATTNSGTQVRQLISARGYLSTSEPVVHFGVGEEMVIERLKVIWPSGHEQVFEDLDTGHRYTITEPEAWSVDESGESASISARFEEVSASFGVEILQSEEEREGTVVQPLLPRRFNRRGPGLAVGDLDGDGIDEIVIGATALDGAKVLRRQGGRYEILDTGSLGEKPFISDGPPLILDANGDGANDVLLTAGGAALPAEEPEYEPRLWLNDGEGRFSLAPEGFLPSLPISVGAAVSADFDRDGKLDLFLGGRLFPGYYPDPAYSVLLLQGEGRMKDATGRFAPELAELGLVTSALASDVDGDGWIDLVLALEWGGIRFFRNLEGKSMNDVSEKWGFGSAGSGLWTSLASGDFNRDGKLDYALGNLGLNTLYGASREFPMKLFVDNFARGGEPQLVLAYNDHGTLYPVASRSELGAKIPEVLKRFPSNDVFAAATLEEILGEEALEAATLYEADELRSGVLLSQPSGTYAFSPLPRLAQIAPTQGMVASDFDRDGFCDLLLVGNDYSPIPAQGRFDGGLGWMLRGDGEGGFEPVPMAESGWEAPGNAKALSLVDLNSDHRPDAVVSRNDQSTLAFADIQSDDQALVSLRLRGGVGNPDAIGARVVVGSGDEMWQVSEIQAGGGYLSQSTPTVFVCAPAEKLSEAKIWIHWPSGAETTIDFPQKSGYLNISE